MMRVPNPETQIKNLKRQVTNLTKENLALANKAKALDSALYCMRVERDQWRARFDKLLERTPKETDHG